jgi:molybdopterin-binding protein
MPRYPEKKKLPGGAKDISPNGNLQLISSPNCKVCQSTNRHYIDILLAKGYSVRKIEEMLAEAGETISYRSIHRHSTKHMNLEMGHFARMAQQRTGDGAFRIISNVALLDVIIQAGWDAMLSGDVEIKIAELVQAIKLREDIEKSGLHTIEEEMGKQMNAIVIAIQEIVPEEMWPKIVNRAKEISKGDMLSQMEMPVLEGKELVAEIVRAEEENLHSPSYIVEEDDDII